MDKNEIQSDHYRIVIQQSNESQNTINQLVRYRRYLVIGFFLLLNIFNFCLGMTGTGYLQNELYEPLNHNGILVINNSIIVSDLIPLLLFSLYTMYGIIKKNDINRALEFQCSIGITFNFINTMLCIIFFLIIVMSPIHIRDYFFNTIKIYGLFLAQSISTISTSFCIVFFSLYSYCSRRLN